MNIKSFKRGKSIDAALQLLLPALITCIDEICTTYAGGERGNFIIALFAAGAVQVCSYLTWLFMTPRSMVTTGRKLYGFLLSVVLAVFLFVWGADVEEYEFEFGFAMIFIAPLLGFYYLFLTLWESKQSGSKTAGDSLP